MKKKKQAPTKSSFNLILAAGLNLLIIWTFFLPGQKTARQIPSLTFQKPEVYYQQTPVEISFTPETLSYDPGQSQQINLLLTPTNPNNKISAFQITVQITKALTADPCLIITDYLTPQETIPSQETINFVALTEEMSSDELTLTYVIDENETNLPSQVTVGIMVETINYGSAGVSLNQEPGTLEIVGPNPLPGTSEDYVYTSVVYPGYYVFPTPLPTGVPTATLTPTPSCIPDCTGKECGEGGCGDPYECGICGMEEYCDNGHCRYDCQCNYCDETTGLCCNNDEGKTSCDPLIKTYYGTDCPCTDECQTDDNCTCIPDCGDNVCGPDNCGNPVGCGVCTGFNEVCENGQCVDQGGGWPF